MYSNKLIKISNKENKLLMINKIFQKWQERKRRKKLKKRVSKREKLELKLIKGKMKLQIKIEIQKWRAIQINSYS